MEITLSERQKKRLQDIQERRSQLNNMIALLNENEKNYIDAILEGYGKDVSEFIEYGDGTIIVKNGEETQGQDK